MATTNRRLRSPASLAWRWSVLCLPALGLPALGCSFLLDFDELTTEAADDDAQGVESDDAGTGVDDPTHTDSLTDATDDGVPTDHTDGAPTGTDGTDDMLPDAATDASTAESCDAGCDDGDPCTVDRCEAGVCVREAMECTASDTCLEASCVNGQCVQAPREGIVQDGLDETVVADAIYRSELVSAGDRFYRATYGVWSGVPDVRIASFDSNTTGVMAEYRFSDALPSDVEVMSPAALAPDTRFGLALHVYVAVRIAGQGASAAGNVARVRLNRDLEPVGESGATLVTSSPNYRFVSNRLGPATGQAPGSEPYVVWGGCTTVGTGQNTNCVATEAEGGAGGIYFQAGDDGLDPNSPGSNYLPEPGALSGLAAIHSGGVAGALWMTNAAPSGVELKLGFNDGSATRQLAQCDVQSGFTGYGLNASVSLASLWTASWSKRMGTNYRTELIALQCQDGSCADTLLQSMGVCPDPLPVGRVQPGTRSLAARSLDRPGDAAELVYQTFAHATSDQDGAHMSLIVNRLDFSADATNSVADAGSRRPFNLADVELARSPPESAPDWPALATLPPDKLAVSWLEPDADSNSDRLRVQRYRICFGD